MKVGFTLKITCNYAYPVANLKISSYVVLVLNSEQPVSETTTLAIVASSDLVCIKRHSI